MDVYSTGLMPEIKRTPLLPFALIVAILAVSTASIFIRFAQQEVPSLVIAALRLTFATLMLAPYALLRYRSELRSLNRGQIMLALFSGGFLALHFATWITSLEYTSVASSVVFVSTGPLWVAIFSPFFLKEKLTRFAIIGLVLAFLGGLIIGLGDACDLQSGFNCAGFRSILHGRSILGNLLALAGALAVSGYLIIGRNLRAGMSLVPYVFIVYGFGALALLMLMFLSGLSPFGFSVMPYLWIVLLAVVPQLIGHTTYNWALRFLPAALVAVTTLGEPIGSAILAFFVLQESPGPVTLIGGIFILGGIFLATKTE